MEHFSAIVSAPCFSLGVICSDETISGIRFLEPRPEQAASTPLAAEAAMQFHAYLRDPQFNFELPLQSAGTLFQKRVWAQIANIPSGHTRYYGDLAKTIANAPRAVGQACGANPLPVIVPCHRVIATGGGLGGFSRQRGGFLLDVKRWLLLHEGHAFDRPRH